MQHKKENNMVKRASKTLDRWETIGPNTLPYRIFKEYYNDVLSMITTFESTKGYAYNQLGISGAKWEDRAYDYGLSKENRIITVRGWSEREEEFGNWVRLGLLVSFCSFFENYIATAIRECLDSDPGILISASHAIDGIARMKAGVSHNSETIEKLLTSCTKGDWNSRIAHLTSLFGTLPVVFSSSIADLEAIRKMRNEYAHAFGRDIASSQDYFNIQKIPISRISVGRFNRFRTIINKIVQEFDKQINSNHIGCFEALLQYHEMHGSIQGLTLLARIEKLKASLYIDRHIGLPKAKCEEIIKYYESI